ncbi:MAG: TIGR03960 family B12-binding radical SAM protein [Anaerolineales bacterium]
MNKTSEIIQNKLPYILPLVQKPARYTGGELNQIVKDWENTDLHFCLVFPDIYDIGMSNLGLAILYDLINQRSDALAERAFAPWIDMEQKLRQYHIPLFSLETKHPLSEFDIIGFTLPYESLFTNLINILDLSNLEIWAVKRSDNHPLIIAGGHATFNPEPIAAFVDAFVIGEGEEVIHEILDVYKDWQKTSSSRAVLLKQLAAVNGVYVPSLYKDHYHPDGTFSHLEKIDPSAPSTISKRIVAHLPPAPYRLVVPYIETVHDRIPIEIMRGCTRGCRFCHAGMVTRPIRERSVPEIIETIRKAVQYTGYDEVGLLSLSSSDYTHISELVTEISRYFPRNQLSISLPSLRIETLSVQLMQQLGSTRRGGFTLAPEAATERMRNIINKPISTEDLLLTCKAIFENGWSTIKLYFMIGHPLETLEDVQAIADLSREILRFGRSIVGNRTQIHVSVSTFIPKPHTPFQWVACDTLENIEQKIQLLQRNLRGRNLKLTWNPPQATFLEAWLSRGDRRLSQVIYLAWKNGAKFDAWNDQRNLDAWYHAFSLCELEPKFYTHRHRPLTEAFPWDHIDIGVRKRFLMQDYELSTRQETRRDCRQGCYACGILPKYNTLRREQGLTWKCPPLKLPTHA